MKCSSPMTAQDNRPATCSCLGQVTAFPVKDVWHEDVGFRKTVILNKAVSRRPAIISSPPMVIACPIRNSFPTMPRWPKSFWVYGGAVSSRRVAPLFEAVNCPRAMGVFRQKITVTAKTGFAGPSPSFAATPGIAASSEATWRSGASDVVLPPYGFGTSAVLSRAAGVGKIVIGIG